MTVDKEQVEKMIYSENKQSVIDGMLGMTLQLGGGWNPLDFREVDGVVET